MKKSIRRKLIMSAVAVGAAALATTSSTYAWFVSNAEVKTTTIQGQVTNSEANLQISADNSTYGVSATPSFTPTLLKPITKASGAAFGAYVDNFGNSISTTYTDGGYIEFTLWFKATGIPSGVKYDLLLNQSEATDKDIDQGYTALANSTGITAGSELKEDVTKALYLSVKTGDSTSVNIPFNSDAETYDGVAYYNAVTGKTNGDSGYATASAVTKHDKDLKSLGTGTTGYTIATITGTSESSVVTSVKFQIWLDGADKAGFDAIAGHKWEVAFNFTLTPSSEE